MYHDKQLLQTLYRNTNTCTTIAAWRPRLGAFIGISIMLILFILTDILTDKGVYAYDYMNSWDKFNEMPSK